MPWVEFPFPRCPSCELTWEVSRHRGCEWHGSIELDPDSKIVRCDGCDLHWNVWGTRFYCSCGWEFDAEEVDEALHEIIRAAQLLAEIMELRSKELAQIRRMGDSSLRSWLNGVAEGIGGALGHAVGFVIAAVFRGLTGR